MQFLNKILLGEFSKPEDVIKTRESEAASGDLQPGQFDRTRMEKALAGPRFEIPRGLSPAEIGEFIMSVAKRHR